MPENSLRLGRVQIVQLLQDGGLAHIPDTAQVEYEVPRGGDYSGMTLQVDENEPDTWVRVHWPNEDTVYPEEPLEFTEQESRDACLDWLLSISAAVEKGCDNLPSAVLSVAASAANMLKDNTLGITPEMLRDTVRAVADHTDSSHMQMEVAIRKFKGDPDAK